MPSGDGRPTRSGDPGPPGKRVRSRRCRGEAARAVADAPAAPALPSCPPAIRPVATPCAPAAVEPPARRRVAARPLLGTCRRAEASGSLGAPGDRDPGDAHRSSCLAGLRPAGRAARRPAAGPIPRRRFTAVLLPRVRATARRRGGIAAPGFARDPVVPASKRARSGPRRRARPPRLPDPRGARPRPAARLARQRGHDAEAAGGDRSPRATSTSTRTRTSTAPPTRWRRARPTPTRPRARRCAASSTRRRRARSSSCAAPPRPSTSSRRAGAGATSSRATRSSSPGSSTTPTSCPGSSSCAEKGARLRVAPGRRPRPGHARRVREAARARGRRLVAFTQVSNALGTVTPAQRDDRDGPPPRARSCWSTARRPSRTCASTCRRSTATSTSSPATRCSRPPASACSSARPSCSTRCRPGRAAAT